MSPRLVQEFVPFDLYVVRVSAPLVSFDTTVRNIQG